MNKSSSLIHYIEFEIGSIEGLSNACLVADDGNGPLRCFNVITFNLNVGLVIYTHFKTSWDPIDKLYGSFCFDSSTSSAKIFWNAFSSVHAAACQVLSVTWITICNHQIFNIISLICDFCHRWIRRI